MHPKQEYTQQQYNSYQQNVPTYAGAQQRPSAYPQGNYAQSCQYNNTSPAQYAGSCNNSPMANPGLQYQMPTPPVVGTTPSWNSKTMHTGSSWNHTTTNVGSTWNPTAAGMGISSNTNAACSGSYWTPNPGNLNMSSNPTSAHSGSTWSPTTANMSLRWNSNPASANPSWNPNAADMGSSCNPKQQTSMYPTSFVSNQAGSSPLANTRSQYGQYMGKRPAGAEMYTQQQLKKPRTDIVETGQSVPYAVEVNGYQEGIHIHGNCYVTLTNNNGQEKPSPSMDDHLNVSVRPVVNATIQSAIVEQLRSPSMLHKIGIIMKTLMSVTKKYLPQEPYEKLEAYMSDNGCLAKVLPESLCSHLLKYESSNYVHNCIAFYLKYRSGMCLLIRKGSCRSCERSNMSKDILYETADVLGKVNAVKQGPVNPSRPVSVSKGSGVGLQQASNSASSKNQSSCTNIAAQPYQSNKHQRPQNCTSPHTSRTTQQASGKYNTLWPTDNFQNQPAYPQQMSNLPVQDPYSATHGGQSTQIMATRPDASWNRTNTNSFPVNYSQVSNREYTSNFPYPSSNAQIGSRYPGGDHNADLQRWNEVQADYVQRDHWQEDKKEFTDLGPSSEGLSIGKWHVPESEKGKVKVPKSDSPATNAMLSSESTDGNHILDNLEASTNSFFNSLMPAETLPGNNPSQTPSNQLSIRPTDGPPKPGVIPQIAPVTSKTSSLVFYPQAASAIPICSRNQKITRHPISAVNNVSQKTQLPHAKDCDVIVLEDSDDENEVVSGKPTLGSNKIPLVNNNILKQILSDSSAQKEQHSVIQQSASLAANAKNPHQRTEVLKQFSRVNHSRMTDSPQSTQFWSHLIQDTRGGPAAPCPTADQSQVDIGHGAQASADSTQPSGVDSGINKDTLSEDIRAEGTVKPAQNSVSNHSDSDVVRVINVLDKDSENCRAKDNENPANSVNPIQLRRDDGVVPIANKDSVEEINMRGEVEGIRNCVQSSVGLVQPSSVDKDVIHVDQESSENSSGEGETNLNFESLFSEGAATFATFTFNESDDEDLEVTTVEIGREDWEKMTHS